MLEIVASCPRRGREGGGGRESDTAIVDTRDANISVIMTMTVTMHAPSLLEQKKD